MSYNTSFYMHITNYVKLLKASQQTGLSMNDLITQLMYHYAKDHKKMWVEDGTVQYQNVDKRENWHVFRITLAKKDYELFTDMRKVMKKSVSLLVALSIKKYLNTIVIDILKHVYKYTSLMHDAVSIKFNNLRYWIFKWKIYHTPPPHARKTTLRGFLRGFALTP